MNKNFSQKIKEIVKSSRKFTLPYFGKVDIVAIKKDGAHDVLTNIDAQVENFLKEEFKKVDAKIGFVGEETGGDRSMDRFWLVDPIDGTNHFVRGIPFCTTMVALIEHGEVTMSIIYNFVTDELFFAEKGKGSFCNDKKILVSSRDLEHAYMCWETRALKPEHQQLEVDLHQAIKQIRLVCAGWEFCMIAIGQIEGRISFDPWGKDYDFAAGCLLVSEAGGKVTNLGKEIYHYKDVNILASNVAVHKQLQQGLLKGFWE